VRNLALVDDGHGLEAAVRVRAHPSLFTRRSGRLEVRRAGVVQHQERADVLSERVVGEQRAHRKPVAHPVLAGVAVNAENFLHHLLLESTLQKKNLHAATIRFER
jgi:hypothetical protein